MEFLQVFVLAVLQGLTEFLPISSSAHLILVPRLLGWPDQGLGFDVAVHVGTLAAVAAYFRRELGAMLRDWFLSLLYRRHTPNSRLAWAVGFGTVPVGLAALLFKDYVENELRSPHVIATATVVFGLLLWWAYARSRQARDEYSLRWRDVLAIGAAQALALIPGTSRSGITMTAGLALGLTGEGAARFSFLLSVPVIFLAGALEAAELAAGGGSVDWAALAMGALLAAVSAYLCIHFFLKALARVGMMPFVLYRLALGAFLFSVFA